MTRTTDVVRAIGWVSFREILRDKVLYNILLCAFLLLAISYLGSRLMIVRPERMVLDFGLSAVGISSAMLAIFTGAGMIGRELERRTFFVALSRPISRFQFVLGKYAGLAMILLLNWALLSMVLSLIHLAVIPKGEPWLTAPLAWSLVLLLFQSLMLGGLALLFSSFSTTALASILTIGLYLVGNNISQLRLIADRTPSPVLKPVLNAFASLLPNFEHFTTGTQVVYGLAVPLQFTATGILYAWVWVTFSLLAAGVLIRGREG
jgi:ABC-type transport system involved in multi-copper enzyme maturation permease subunit